MYPVGPRPQGVAARSKSLHCLSAKSLCRVMSAVFCVSCVLCVAWLCHVPMVFVGAAVAAADGQDRPRERKKKVQSFSALLRLCLCVGSVMFGVHRKTK